MWPSFATVRCASIVWALSLYPPCAHVTRATRRVGHVRACPRAGAHTCGVCRPLLADDGVSQNHFQWDVDLSLCGCGLPLPEAIESRMISTLLTYVLRSHNRANPLVIDLADFVAGAQQRSAALALQAQWRGKETRRKTSLDRAVNSSSKLEAQVAAMQEEVSALKQTVGELRRELQATQKAAAKKP